MCRIRPKIIFLFIVLFMFTCDAGAEEELFWPAKRDLLCKDWSKDEPQSWVKVGDVKILSIRPVK